MKLLVFGKTGQVATELARIYPQARFVDRHEADLTKPQVCAALLKSSTADVVVNAAAYTAVDKAESEQEQALLINGHTVNALAEQAAAMAVPFLHISTDYVFEGGGKRAWKPEDETAPINFYGHSKWLGEQGVRSAGGPHAVVRTSWVFSAHGNNFVKSMLRLGAEREQLNIVDDQIGGPTAAADLAAAMLEMAKAFYKGEGQSGTYHFSGGPDCSWAEFAREIFAQSGFSTVVNGIPTSAYPTPAQRPLNSRLNCEKIGRNFGISRPDWRVGLTNVLKELGACRDVKT